MIPGTPRGGSSRPALAAATEGGSQRRALSREDQGWALVEAVQRLSLARSVGEVQEIVRASARWLTGADGATFILREGESCFYADEDAVGPLWKGQRFPLERCISGWVMLNREPVTIDDIYADDRIPHDAYRPTFVKSLAMVPIRTVEPIGAIGNYWADHYRPSADEVELLQALADSTAVALENARTLEALEQRAHATAAFTFVSDGVCLVDAAGIVRSWNPAAARIAGVAVNDAIGKPIENALSGWSDVADRVPVHRAEEDERPRRDVLPLSLRTGERWLSICGTRFVGGTVYTFEDVTGERALEELRSDLIATVSHELRTPLTAVHGAVATLRRTDVDIDPALRERLLSMIQTQSGRLTKLLDEILLASRLEADALVLAVEPTDPRLLVEEVVETARTAHPEAEIALEAPAAVRTAELDAEKVRQVLRNLVENAIRYGDGAVAVRLGSTAGALRFDVHDDGAGIPPAEQVRIFEKFYRADAAGKPSGTGLGLYICRELVERMNGSLTMTSGPGQGTTFTVELPS